MQEDFDSLEEESDEEDFKSAKKKRKGAGGSVKKEREEKVEGDPWGLKSAAAAKDWKQLRCPPLEMFHFARVYIPRSPGHSNMCVNHCVYFCSSERRQCLSSDCDQLPVW